MVINRNITVSSPNIATCIICLATKLIYFKLFCHQMNPNSPQGFKYDIVISQQ
jgi:hypothetical protein